MITIRAAIGLLALSLAAACEPEGATNPDPDPPADTTPPALQLLVDTLSRPLFVTAPPGDTDRVFVVLQGGEVRILRRDTLLATPFISIAGLVSGGNEQGLLGLAFHPEYATNGRFYLSYTDTIGDTRIVRYNVSADPDVADPVSTDTVLALDQPFANHNGGMIVFGPDDYLYIGLGDGGSSGDPQNNGQAMSTLLGKLLRINVDGATGYTIPATNPFVGVAGARGEIWAFGLRNPWRFSFDRETGDLYIADVGQNQREEVNVVSAGTSGRNYGWNVMEGLQCFPPTTTSCNQAGLTPPVLDYSHAEGCSVTGGYVYRGTRVPLLDGVYLYADFCSGFVRGFRWNAGVISQQRDWDLLEPGGQIPSFGEDGRGDVYVVSRSPSGIHRIIRSSR
jgi:glucose/arabinose dehydrogenase